MEKRSKPKSKLRKILTIGSIVVGLLAIGLGVYAFTIYNSLHETAQKVYKPLNEAKEADLPLNKVKSNSPPINILLLGVDERIGDKGRSDTMIVLTLNPKTKSMQMVSIPRDTRVQVPGRSGYDKINAAYAYGNEGLAVQTVEKYLNINISYYVKMNMEGLSNLVDTVGGVTVNNDIDWTSGGYHYAKGELNLDGSHALVYARMRHQDYRGDFGRNIRQRQVIQAVINKGTNFTSITKIRDVLGVLGNNVTTNLTFDDMKRLATEYRDCRQNIINYETKGTPKFLNGISWVIVSNQEFQHVHDMIQKEL